MLAKVKNQKRILVTGGNGLVGSAISQVSSNYPEVEFIFTNRTECDLTNELQGKHLYEKINPSHVIHTAAFVGGIGRNLANPAGQYYKNILI